MMALLGGHGHEKGRAMKHRNSVLHGMLSYLPWKLFDELVAAHGADKWVRTLSTKCQFVALLIGQLSGFCGLRETVAGVNSQAARLYHLGAREIARSTFADANAHRPSAVFEALFAALVVQAGRGLRRTLDGATSLIDSTSLRLNQHSADWARYSATVCGAKVHVIYDPNAAHPVYAAFSTATVNDISAAQKMPIVPGATYVFDLGYYDYCWWAELHAADCRIVTRLKKNTPLTLTRERLIPPGGIATSRATILSDRIGHLPERQAGRRSNPMSDEMREVRVRLDTGKVLRILTNDLVAPAHEIVGQDARHCASQTRTSARTSGCCGGRPGAPADGRCDAKSEWSRATWAWPGGIATSRATILSVPHRPLPSRRPSPRRRRRSCRDPSTTGVRGCPPAAASFPAAAQRGCRRRRADRPSRRR